MLKATVTPQQEEIALAVLQPPYRVLVKSGHNIGKSWLAAWLVNWWYDTRPNGIAITTGPDDRAVKDVLWTEIRLQRQRAWLADEFIGPSAPEMRTGPDHYAKGFTAASGESFQGRHRQDMAFVFEEGEGVEAVYWKTTNTMFQPDGSNIWVVILNPTTTTSWSFQEERAVDANGNRKWKVFSLSSLDHPNILAAHRGEPAPIPNAVSIEQVQTWIGDWFEPIEAGDADHETDIEFPPDSGHWYRPGPEGESRVLGRRPSAGTFGVWSEKLWEMACRDPIEPPIALPEIGHDAARFGDDRSETHVRCGPCSMWHEDHGGWDVVRQADRLMLLADQWTIWHNKRRPPQAFPVMPKSMRIKVDDTGVGGGVTDILHSRGYNAIAVNAGCKADDPTKYPRVRDELWFTVKELARQGKLDLTRLGTKRLAKLEVQALAPTWKPTPDRKRLVESKEETKKRLGRSPDGLDALNLAYCGVGPSEVASWVDTSERKNWRDRHSKPMRTMT